MTTVTNETEYLRDRLEQTEKINRWLQEIIRQLGYGIEWSGDGIKAYPLGDKK